MPRTPSLLMRQAEWTKEVSLNLGSAFLHGLLTNQKPSLICRHPRHGREELGLIQ